MLLGQHRARLGAAGRERRLHGTTRDSLLLGRSRPLEVGRQNSVRSAPNRAVWNALVSLDVVNIDPVKCKVDPDVELRSSPINRVGSLNERPSMVLSDACHVAMQACRQGLRL